MTRSILILALTVTAAVAKANDDALIRRQYAEQMAAVNTSNERRLLATIDRSFTQVETSGKTITMGEYSRGLTSLFAAFKSGSMKYKIGAVKYSHGTATVDYQLEGDLITRRGLKMHDIERGIDTWKKVGNGYLQVHEVVKFARLAPAGTRTSV